MSSKQETQGSYSSDEESVDLPRKSVDPDESLDERLTDNVVNRIGPARYFERDENGNAIESWDAVFDRVAQNIAEAEYIFDGDEHQVHTWKTMFENAMREQRFMPNSPTLMNAGLPLQQLSACFVRSPSDSIDDITKAQSDTTKIFKSGGGVGYAFHHLRPKGARVDSTGGVSSGPLSFMELYDTTCETVKQGGKRRGAQMAIMHCQHPDIGRFAVSKRGEDRFSNFNISFGITDEFKDAVENDDTIVLYDPESTTADGPLSDGDAFEVVAETAHFYDPQFEDAWNDEFDKPGIGVDGKPVESNFWRDYEDEMETDFSEFRDQIDLKTGEVLELPARFLWQLLIDGAHNNGEPGIFYLDETNREHSFDVEEHPEHFIHSTNPCVTGDTLVYTDSGPVEARDLYEQGTATAVTVDSRLSEKSIKEASSVYKTGEKPVYTLTTEEGYELRLTEDHRVQTEDGWTEAGELESGDEIHILDREGGFGQHGSSELGRVLGWLVGDGHLKHGEERAVLNFYDEDTVVSDQFADDVNSVIREPVGNADYEVGVSTVNRSDEYRGSQATEQRVRSTRLYELASDAGLTEQKLQVPDTVMRGSRETARSFLRALFAADGSVQGTPGNGASVRLGTVSMDLAQDVQRLLLNFGIRSTIYENRNVDDVGELPDGQGGTAEYETQQLHEVSIAADALETFHEKIGFVLPEKEEQLDDLLNSYTKGPYSKPDTATVESVEHDGVEPVFDLTEPDTDSFVANGLVVHNCSEQPLEEFEACNLGHVNLSLMVDETAPSFDEFVEQHQQFAEHTDGGGVVSAYLNRALNQDLFDETVTVGTRFLDNVVTQSEFPLDEISEQVRSKRKIGLGLMGFHQMLIQMGIEYGSETSYAVARQIMQRIDERATRTSHDLAHERGTFEEYEESKWADPTAYPEWFRTHAHTDPQRYEDGFEMRNHNVTTIAPTGTTSMIGNTTGGCEPIYQVAYFKNVGDDIQGDEMLVEFDDYFLEVLEANGIDVDAVKEEATEKMLNNEFDEIGDLERVPDNIAELFVTTQDLDAEQHIRMQAAFQEYCDSGISKTLNMSNDVTVDEVGDAFMLALDLGIKGTTVYRDGSRSEQVKTTRVDNSLEDGDLSELSDDQLVEHLVDQRNLSVKAEHEIRKELGVKPDPDNAERECDECGSGQLDMSEGCPICLDCGFSPCN